MISHATRMRAMFSALAVAAVLVPTGLAKTLPAPDDGQDTVIRSVARAVKPTLEATTPQTQVSQQLYLQALAGTATTSE